MTDAEYMELHIEVVQDLTVDCFDEIKSKKEDEDSRNILANIRVWAVEFENKYGKEFPEGDYLWKVDFFAYRCIRQYCGRNKIEQRVFNIIESNPFPKMLGFFLFNDADHGLIFDYEDILTYLVHYATKEVKRAFMDEFCPDWADTGLRVCDNCGHFMTEGYILGEEYACSDECAIKLYDLPEDEAKKQFEQDLSENDDDCYWTEWEQAI